MGLSHEQHADQQRRLNPPTPQPANAKPELVTEDPTIGNEEFIRGLPAVGRVSGTIKGTRPGDSARALEQAGRDILRASLDRNKYRPKEQT